MEKFKNLFVEFKSIFVTENVLEENERHANIVTATTMFNLFSFCILTYLLTTLNVFKVDPIMMKIVIITSMLLLAIPALICFALKGRGKNLKLVLFMCLTTMLAMADCILKYNATLVMVIPIVLAARYYNRKFTVGVAVITAILFALSTYLNVYVGKQDINSYNLIIPEGTVFTVNSTLRDAVTSVQVDEIERIKNIFIHFFLPKLFLYNIIAFACIQISQSGKKMIKHQQEISKKGVRIETELNLANTIQKNMLPSIFPPFPEHKEIDIYALMVPAKEVGGDFYDMFLIDDNHLGFVMADVSGKGIPAALVMMISKILIKNVTNVEKDVGNAFNRVNNMLCDGNKAGIFVTAWLGILNLETGVLEFVNAGHNPPLLFSKSQKQFTYLRTKPNMVLAGIENTNYQKHEIKIEPGDRIFLYTDGVVEATNSINQLYGEERLLNFLNSNTELNANDTIIAVKKDIDKFVGNVEQFDDITMLEVIYKGNDLSVAEKSFKADIRELNNVQAFIQHALKKCNCDNKTIMQMNLATEEIFVNIANYAYSNENGDCNVIISFDQDKTFKIRFEDKGVQFNPLERREPDVSLSADEREIGGLGIFITKKIVDNIEYHYEGEKNILELTKIIN